MRRVLGVWVSVIIPGIGPDGGELREGGERAQDALPVHVTNEESVISNEGIFESSPLPTWLTAGRGIHPPMSLRASKDPMQLGGNLTPTQRMNTLRWW